MIYFTLIILNLILIFSLNKISKIINIYDKPDGKLKIHSIQIPILGGFLLFINFSIIMFLQIFFLNDFLIFEKSFYLKREILSLFFFIAVFFIIGLYDDRYTVNPYTKLSLFVLLSFTLLLINQNLIVKNFFLSFYEDRIFLNEISIFFTIFCILILINALNFYDGINGQSGIFFISVFSFLYLISDYNYFYLVLILLLILFTILNFLNKLFFGDSGIYLVGSILIVCLIYEHDIKKNINYADEIFFLLLLPVIDLVRLTIYRLLIFKNPFLGDRNHIHHLLIRRLSLFNTNLLLFCLSVIPIVLFSYFKMNFFLVFLTFLAIYLFLIQFLKSYDKKYNHRKK